MNRIQELRLQRNISLYQFADDLSINVETLYTIESNQYIPSVTLAMKIARYFDTTTKELFFDDEQQMKKSRWDEMQKQQAGDASRYVVSFLLVALILSPLYLQDKYYMAYFLICVAVLIINITDRVLNRKLETI
jgi:putative transcriptional regulator